MQKIKKGDKVLILLGKDRGKSSTVEKVFNKEGKLLVADVNKVKRHIGKKVTGSEGGVLEIEKPVNRSNVALLCPNCNKPTRVGFRVTSQSKVRVCKKCRKEII